MSKRPAENHRSTTARQREEYARVSDGTVHLVQKAPRQPRHSQAFAMVFQSDMASFIASDVGRKLTAVQLRVLVRLWSTVEYDNTVIVNISHVAKAMNTERASVSRAFTALENLGLLRREPHPDDPRCRLLSLNAHLVYKGNVVGRREAIRRQTWAPSGSQMGSQTTSGTASRAAKRTDRE